MGVNVSWDNPERTVIRHTFEDPWTLEEHKTSLYEIQAMVASQNHTVHSIADLSKTKTAPGRLMLNTRVAESIRQSNSGLLFMVQAPGLVKSIVRASERFMPKVAANLTIVDTCEEAYAIIRAHEQAQGGARPPKPDDVPHGA